MGLGLGIDPPKAPALVQQNPSSRSTPSNAAAALAGAGNVTGPTERRPVNPPMGFGANPMHRGGYDGAPGRPAVASGASSGAFAPPGGHAPPQAPPAAPEGAPVPAETAGGDLIDAPPPGAVVDELPPTVVE